MEIPIDACRWCMGPFHPNVKKSNIFDHRSIIANLINGCFRVEIKKLANVPEEVCAECLTKMNHTCEFYTLIRKSEKHWNEIFKSFNEPQLVIKSEPDSESKPDNIKNITDQRVLRSTKSMIVLVEKLKLPEPEVKDDLEDSNALVEEVIEEVVDEFLEVEEIPVEEEIVEMEEDEAEILETRPEVQEDTVSDILEDTLDDLGGSIEDDDNSNFEPEKDPDAQFVACSDCGKLVSKGTLQKHNQNWHSGEVSCDICQKVFPRKNLLDSHKKSVHKNNCEICGELFTGKRLLNAHLKDIHKEESKLICPECGKMFTKYHLKRHIKLVHSGEVSCGICHKVFANNMLLLRHNHVWHSGEEAVICDTCGKSFSRKNLLITHIREVHNPKIQECPICHEYVKNLYRHHKNRHEKKPRPCPKCGHVLYSASAYCGHLNRCGEKPTMPCSVCGKMYYSKSDLKEHENKHFGITVKCDFCDFEAPDRRTRNNHMTAHHPKEYAAQKADRKKQVKTLCSNGFVLNSAV